MAKYDPLYEFLGRQSCSRIVMTFSEVARIIGDDELVDSAFRYPAWWANETNPNPPHVQKKAWLNAGFKAHPDLDKQMVVFER